jgi:hypothetical protein
MCPILDGYGVMTVFFIPVHALVWTESLGWRIAIFIQLQTERCRYLETWELPKAWWVGMSGRATRAVHNGAAACVATGHMFILTFFYHKDLTSCSYALMSWKHPVYSHRCTLTYHGSSPLLDAGFECHSWSVNIALRSENTRTPSLCTSFASMKFR